MEDVMAKGVGHVQQAVVCDQAGQYSEALRLYDLGLQSFVLVLKYERNDRVRNTLEAKIKEYLSRAEAIKTHLLSGKSPVSLSDTSTSPPRVLFPPPTSSLAHSRSPSSHSSSHSSPSRSSHPSPSPSPSSPSPSSSSSLHSNSHTHAQSIKIRQGQIGCSYDSLFGGYFAGASVISVEDPYIRADHQIQNFARFCELVMKRAGNECLIHLMTSAESPDQRSHIDSSFSLLKSSLSSVFSDPSSSSFLRPVQLVLTFSDTMHDRAIRLNNGWVIKIGRGLDIYSKPQNKFCVGNFDLDLRPCLETTVDIFKEAN